MKKPWMDCTSSTIHSGHFLLAAVDVYAITTQISEREFVVRVVLIWQ